MATHNRAGEILYRHLPGNTASYEFTIVTYTESASQADRDTLVLQIFACGTGNTIAEISIGRTLIAPVGGGIQRNEYKYSPFTFPGPGCYRLTMRDPNRIDGIINITSSVNVAFYIEDTLMINDPQFFGFNSSPVLLTPPIDFAATGQIFIHNPAAYDQDGDSLTFTFIEPMQDPSTAVPGYHYPDFSAFSIGNPDSFNIDFNDGELVWNVAQSVGIYNVAILIREFRQGKYMGSMVRDMQIIVLDNPNNPPVLSMVHDTCIVAGNNLNKTIHASDPDIFPIPQKVTLTAQGGPFFLNNSPATFTSNSPANPVTGIFNWQTNCDHVRPQPYTVVFKAKDNYVGTNNKPEPYVDIETWNIKVVAPAPQNVQAFPNGNQVDISWDNPYACAGSYKFLGFSVWRKKGCDSLLTDTCQTGMAGLGYTKLSGKNPIKVYSFSDLNTKSGNVYSYRVLAEFADTTLAGYPYNPVSSLPSIAACVEIPRDVPVITHVDVRLTDPSAGSIMVKWVKADAIALDTITNPGPYKYELYRYKDFIATGSPTLVMTDISASFTQLTQDTFLDAGLNTLDNAYNYILKFYATDLSGNFYNVGDAENASSVYLSIASGGSHLKLSWDYQVPWTNYRFDIYKENISIPGQFDSLTTLSNTAYNDYQVVVGQNYCYKIKAYGTYSNPSLPEPLINYSEIKCEIPIDTTPSCAPNLKVSNGCEGGSLSLDPADLKNILTWNNPNNTCADDVSGYRIYFKATDDATYQLLDTIQSASDTVYVHDNLLSLAGCYVLTAIDSFGNESIYSNEVCLDNCPNYVLPNVFTPNADGSNDDFHPFLPYYFVDHIDIKIFDRWGVLVFESTDPAIHWNGKRFNTGKDLNDGVYYYVCDVYEIRLNGIHPLSQPLNGYIHLIRGN